VTVGGKPLAAVTSGSTLRADGTAAHTASAPKEGSLVPSNLTPIAFVPPTGIGEGKPSKGAGSTLLVVDGSAALLAGDAFDTCGVATGKDRPTVAASGQSFVTCSE
jgi:hypothetical protein